MEQGDVEFYMLQKTKRNKKTSISMKIDFRWQMIIHAHILYLKEKYFANFQVHNFVFGFC